MSAKSVDTEPQICFFITPIGEDGSETRRRTDGIFNMVIKPLSEEFAMHAIVAHKKNMTGDITTGIVNDIYKAKLVIADLTSLNPNVMYEIALRDAMKKPIILIAEKGTKIPFDISMMNTIIYTNDFYGTQELQQSLREFIDKIDFQNYKAVNVITKSEADINIYHTFDEVEKPEISDILKIIYGEINALKQSTDYYSSYIYNLSNKQITNINENSLFITYRTKSFDDAIFVSNIAKSILSEINSLLYDVSVNRTKIIVRLSECDKQTGTLVNNKIMKISGDKITSFHTNFE